MTNNNLIRQQYHGDDEYYTLYEEVKYVVETYVKDNFKDKIVYCPCDTEQSNIVKYLKENKLSVGYKDLIYSSNDFHENRDLFEKCDVIFTNPPFKHYPKTLRFIEQFNKEFVLWAPKNTVCQMDLSFTRYKVVGPPNIRKYERPDGSLVGVGTYIISNIDNINEYEWKLVDFKYSLEEALKTKYVQNNINIEDRGEMSNELKEKTKINVDRIKFYPNDYYGPVCIPVTAFMSYRNRFELMAIRSDDVPPCARVHRSDGTISYIRVIVKLKK